MKPASIDPGPGLRPGHPRAPRLLHQALGGQLLDVVPPGRAGLFYLSPLNAGGERPARGGCPVLFPQFAEYGPLPKHGYARTLAWSLLSATDKGAHSRIRYRLEIRADDFPDWPHAACLELLADAGPNALTLTLQVRNTGEQAFAWSGGLHPYFAVVDLAACRLQGLQGLSVQDRFHPERQREQAASVGWDGAPFECLFDGCPLLRLDAGQHALQLSAWGFEQWMVWNPGVEGASGLADLPDADWRRFVCIEPVCVSRPVKLVPGACFQGGLRIAWQ